MKTLRKKRENYGYQPIYGYENRWSSCKPFPEDCTSPYLGKECLSGGSTNCDVGDIDCGC